MTTQVFKMKCMSCQLHFAAYSWSPNWQPGFCPECGSTGPFLIWWGSSNLEIYEHVPGSTPLFMTP